MVDIALGKGIEYGRVNLDLAVEQRVEVGVEDGGVIVIPFRFLRLFLI